MIEVIATLLRWLQLASNMILVGGCVFLAIAGSYHSPWVTRLERSLPWLCLILLIGLLGILATTTAQATGISENAWRPEAWLALMQNTRMGHIWIGRAICALIVTAIALYLRHSERARWKYVLCATVAAVTLAVGSLASHSAAEELSVLSILPYALHIILASVWFGALPAFLVVCYACTEPASSNLSLSNPGSPGKQPAMRAGIQTEAIQRIHALFQSREEAVMADAQALKRFSAMALPVMLAVIATGIIITDRMVDTSYGALVATSYGWLLNAKIALLVIVLIIAARARSTWLPLLAQRGDSGSAQAGGQRLRKWVSFEFVLALGIVLLATIVANTVPAKHAIIQNWPYSFRFSLAATWGDQMVMLRVWSGVALLLLAGVTFTLGSTKKWNSKRRLGISALLLAPGCRRGVAARWPSTPTRKPTARPRCRLTPSPSPTARPCSPRTAWPAMAPRARAMASWPRAFQAAGGHAHRAAHRQAYRRRLLPLAHLRHSRYRHAGICRQALRRGPLGRGQLPARHVARLPGAPDEPQRQARPAPAFHGPAQFLLCRARRLKRHAEGLPRPEERAAGAVLMATVARAPGAARSALSRAGPCQYGAAGGAGG